MAEITLYRQARRDGGKRTGIEVAGSAAFSQFEEGTADADPALVWYIDVRCSGPDLPGDRDAAHAWLLQHSEEIAALVTQAADEVPMGYDPVEWPLQVSGQVAGADVVVAASAVRRVEARELAGILREFAGHVRRHVQMLGARPAA